MIIRAEENVDREAVRDLVASAFGRTAESELLDALRKDGDLVFGGVAVADDEVTAYIAFSKMTAPFPALGIGPLATSKTHRRGGAASALLRWGLAQAASQGWRAVFVLGDPVFYRRFSFDTALADCFSSAYGGPNFMALAIGGPLPTLKGAVGYAPAFQKFLPS